MRRSLGATACLLVAVGSLAACAPTARAPVTSTASATATPSSAPDSPVPDSPSPSDAPDFTQPGVAQDMVDDLLAAADSTTAVMVAVTRHEVRVAVESDGATETWAYRDGHIGTVQSDIVYVDQAAFYPGDYALEDVGALFRAALAVSGSDESQELQIVDYSGGIVAMSVSTTPESRTVFFTRAGEVVPTLDMTTHSGVVEAYRGAVGARTRATQVAFSSTDGVYLDDADAEAGTITRYQRATRTPVIISTRSETTALEPFDPRTIDPEAVWAVIEQVHSRGSYSYADPWSCVIDDREGTGSPRMYFEIGSVPIVTTLDGERIRV